MKTILTGLSRAIEDVGSILCTESSREEEFHEDMEICLLAFTGALAKIKQYFACGGKSQGRMITSIADA